MLNFEERVTTAPESHKQTKLRIEAPPAEEFDISALLSIVSDEGPVVVSKKNTTTSAVAIGLGPGCRPRFLGSAGFT